MTQEQISATIKNAREFAQDVNDIKLWPLTARQHILGLCKLLEAAHARYAGGESEAVVCEECRGSGITYTFGSPDPEKCYLCEGDGEVIQPVGYAGGGEADLEEFIKANQFDVERDNASDVISADALRDWFASRPAPEVPDKKPEPEHLPDWDPHNHYVKGWNECRQAMIVASRENK